MLLKSIKYCIRNKWIAFLLLLLFVFLGSIHAPFSWNLGGLPRDPVAVDAIPDIGENQQIIFSKWEGKSPQDIEDQITYPLTSALLGIPGVKTIRSSSMFGFSSIYLIFEDDIEFYWSRSRISDKLNALPEGTLPEGVQPSLGPDATGLGQIFWYTLEGRDQEGNVTGGWDLHELRSIQDEYVKHSLLSAGGVAEVASIGGYVKEYQIDVQPEVLKQYGIGLQQVVRAVKESNQDIGAQTLEINKVEYLVRGLGYIKSIKDIENTVVVSSEYISVRIKDIATVTLGPAARRGILDKEGAEVVGGVVVSRYGANPMEVISNVKNKIKELHSGLPSKVLRDGRTSQLTIIPFYDRSELIAQTLDTLTDALSMELLITILVVLLMLYNLRASILISGILPVAILMVFTAMKLLDVNANILALSGIAIAIGTIVDLGVILIENIKRHLDENQEKLGTNTIVFNATKEVSGAIITAVFTTIISFLPIFTFSEAEGKLFRPLAYTKTMTLVASILVTLFLIPPLAAVLFKNKKQKKWLQNVFGFGLIVVGILALIYGYILGLICIAFGINKILKTRDVFSEKYSDRINIAIACITIMCLLAIHWRPIGVQNNVLWSLMFVVIICLGIWIGFRLFIKYYSSILQWALANKFGGYHHKKYRKGVYAISRRRIFFTDANISSTCWCVL